MILWNTACDSATPPLQLRSRFANSQCRHASVTPSLLFLIYLCQESGQRGKISDTRSLDFLMSLEHVADDRRPVKREPII